MNVERAKELLPIIQAFAEGKKIEMALFDGDGALSEWSDDLFPTWSDNYIYRIKPEPKYRPFKDAEECWAEMQKHQPFGWIKPNIGKEKYIITVIIQGYYDIKINENFHSFKYIFENFTFADGTPFGKLEE